MRTAHGPTPNDGISRPWCAKEAKRRRNQVDHKRNVARDVDIESRAADFRARKAEAERARLEQERLERERLERAAGRQ